MENLTRERWNAYTAGLARANGGVDVAKKFNVTPSVQQKLEKKIQESSAFLKRINVVPVTQQMGQKLGLGMTGPIASRTNTKGDKSRKTKDVSVLDGQNYLCSQTNFDTHIRYEKLDMWAAFPEFASMVSDMRFERCALDRQMIGFNGTHAAEDTDLEANPLLQDVNKGWLQLVREFAPERVLNEGATGSGKIKVGGVGSDFKTLDGLVYDLANTLLDPWHVGAPDLVVILGRDLMHSKLFPIVDGQSAPTEMLAAGLVVSQARVANMQAVAVPFFPAKGLMITSFKNLSIYWQKQARRMHVQEKPEKDRVETYESSNDAYVVEEFGKVAQAENIEMEL